MLAMMTQIAYEVPRDYSFVIDQDGIIQYMGSQVDITALTAKIDELLQATAAGDVPDGSNRLQLNQNFPNPFNPSTTISFVLPAGAPVSLTVYSADGQLVRELVKGDAPAGLKEISWDGRNAHGHLAGSGVYFYRLKMGDKVLTKKMVLIK
jgi:hypothetical protein